MSEIIKRGKLPSEKTHKTFCHACGTTFKFTESEARFSSDRDGNAMVISCPVCKKEIWIAV